MGFAKLPRRSTTRGCSPDRTPPFRALIPFFPITSYPVWTQWSVRRAISFSPIRPTTPFSFGLFATAKRLRLKFTAKSRPRPTPSAANSSVPFRTTNTTSLSARKKRSLPIPFRRACTVPIEPPVLQTVPSRKNTCAYRTIYRKKEKNRSKKSIKRTPFRHNKNKPHKGKGGNNEKENGLPHGAKTR